MKVTPEDVDDAAIVAVPVRRRRVRDEDRAHLAEQDGDGREPESNRKRASNPCDGRPSGEVGKQKVPAGAGAPVSDPLSCDDGVTGAGSSSAPLSAAQMRDAAAAALEKRLEQLAEKEEKEQARANGEGQAGVGLSDEMCS